MILQRCSLIAACVTTLALASTVSIAQWTQTSGPRGGVVTSMMSHGGTLFLGTSGGSVFSSADNGATWTSASAGLPGEWIYSLAAVGSTYFAGAGWTGVYRSTDGGAHWESANTGVSSAIQPYNSYCCAYALASDGTTLYACVGTMVVYSSDNGGHWQRPASGIAPRHSLEDFSGGIVVLGSHVFAANAYRGIHHSTDHGRTWVKANSGLTDTTIVSNSLVVNGTDLFVATETGGIFRSTDNGGRWNSANNGLPSASSTALLAVSGVAYAVCKDTLFQWADNGTRWTRVAAVPRHTLRLWSFGSAMFCSGNTGLYRSTDNGATWTAADQKLSATSIYCFAGRGPTILAGTTTDAVFRSSDFGAAWTPLSTERVNGMVNCLAFSGPNLIAGGTSLDGGIDLSTDLGASWNRVTPGSKAQIEVMAVAEPYVYAAGEGIWTSSDNGSTWSQQTAGVGNNYFSGIAVLDASIYAAESMGDTIFVSRNHGSTWSPLPAGKRISLACLAAYGSALLAGTYGQGFLRSTDRGSTWSFVNNGLTDTIVTDIAAGSGMIFAATRDRGVFFLTDGAVEWNEINGGLESPHIQRLFVHDGSLYAGTFGHGVWRRPLSTVTGADRHDRLPSAYTVEQNYPNPFNPVTAIRSTLPEASHVMLTVFTTLGQHVGTVFKGVRGPGSYVDVWRSDAASGLYFYRLDASSVSSPHTRYSVTKKMLLLR